MNKYVHMYEANYEVRSRALVCIEKLKKTK